MHIVWFKRDLRLQDHEALCRAPQLGPVLLLYIVEPNLWQQPDMSYRHYAFLQDCLSELDQDLGKLGQGLSIIIGDAGDVLENIDQRYNIKTIRSHQETWNDWTFERDKAVKHWGGTHNISWHEPAQNGVIRRLHNRDGWATRWYSFMKQPIFEAPKNLTQMTCREKYHLKN